MSALKSALSYEDQIQRLVNVHDLKINDYNAAINILQNVGYYRLSGYGTGLKRYDDPEKFIAGVTIEQLYGLHEFDSKFRNLLMHMIEYIEIQLRVRISQYLSLKYGPEFYLDSKYFISRCVKKGKETVNVHKDLIEKLAQEIVRQSGKPFVKHHNSKYSGHFPFWVAIGLFTFGMLTSMYGILLPDDQETIAKFYGTTKRRLSGWLLALLETRNICAHHSRLYNMNLKQKPYLYSEYKQYRNTDKIFPLLLVLKRWFRADQKRWEPFYAGLLALFSEYEEIVRLPYLGFPDDWQNVLRGKS